MVNFYCVDILSRRDGLTMAYTYCSVILYFNQVILNVKKPPPRYKRKMHSEEVPQIGIESTIPLRQPHCHAAVDADEHYRHGQWSIDDRSEILPYYSYVRYLK